MRLRIYFLLWLLVRRTRPIIVLTLDLVNKHWIEDQSHVRTRQYIAHISIEPYRLQDGPTKHLDHLGLLLYQLTLTLMLDHTDHTANLFLFPMAHLP